MFAVTLSLFISSNSNSHGYLRYTKQFNAYPFIFTALTVAGDLTNIILDPIFIFTLRLGVSGAAIAHVLSQ